MQGIRRSTLLVTMAALGCLALASTADAEVYGGLRVGFSSTPDQVLVGGQFELSPVAENLYIIPSGELGFGDHATTLSFNGDIQYRFKVHSEVRPYAGGGITVYYFNLDGGGSDTNLGAEALGGIFFNRNSSNPMFVDVKLGLTDEVPDWKFIYGINFK